jgi:ADP-heptose:LPS heptosyltransferase
LELWLSEEDKAFAEEVLEKHDVQAGEVIVGFGLSGGSSALKQWPTVNFIELGSWLQAEYRARIVLVGGPGEEALGRKIEEGLNSLVINMIGRTSLRQMAALLQRCHLYIGNDAGPIHVAAAIGIPMVALFTSSCPHRFGPWGNNHIIIIWPALPCSPCFQEGHLDRCKTCIFDQPHCLLSITVEQVKEAVAKCVLPQGIRLTEVGAGG